MSIELTAYLVRASSDLRSRWLAELSQCGFACELHPSIELLAPDTDGVWLKVLQFPASKKRIKPDAPLLVGFGFQADSRALLEQKAWLPKAAQSMTEAPWQWRVCSRTAMGTSTMSRNLQLLGMAALAYVADGYFESEGGELMKGANATKYALDQLSMSTLHDAGELPFEAWPPTNPDDEASFVFPEPIAASESVARPWWKLWA